MNKVSSFEIRTKCYLHIIKLSHILSQMYLSSFSDCQYLLMKKALYGPVYLLTLIQHLPSACGRKRKLTKPDDPLICHPFPAAFLSPLPLPYQIPTAQEAGSVLRLAWGHPHPA